MNGWRKRSVTSSRKVRRGGSSKPSTRRFCSPPRPKRLRHGRPGRNRGSTAKVRSYCAAGRVGRRIEEQAAIRSEARTGAAE